MRNIVVVTDNLKKIFEIASDVKNTNSIRNRQRYILEANFIKELASMPNVNLTVMTEKGSRLYINNVNVVEVKYKSSQNYYLPEVNRLLSSWKIDGILSFNLPSIYGNPILFSHSLSFQRKNEHWLLKWFRNIFQSFQIEAQKKTFMCASSKTKFFVLSEKMKEDYHRSFGLNPENIIVIEPCCKHILDAPLVSKNDRISFGIELSEKLVTNDLSVLIALGIVKLSGYDFNLKIVIPKGGIKFLYRFIINIFGLNKNMQLFLDRTNIIDFYSRINVLIRLANNEASGLCAMEAMSIGIPCCVLEGSGVAEVVKSRNGFVMEDDTIREFSEGLKKIISLYENDFERFKKYSYNAFFDVQNYSWREFACNIVNKL